MLSFIKRHRLKCKCGAEFPVLGDDPSISFSSSARDTCAGSQCGYYVSASSGDEIAVFYGECRTVIFSMSGSVDGACLGNYYWNG